MRLCRLLLLCCLGSCTSNPPVPVPVPELARIISGNTLVIPQAGDDSNRTVAYFHPDGTGWLDASLAPETEPRATELQTIIRWYIAGDSSLCYWPSPPLGHMPSNPPLQPECFRMVWSPTQPPALSASLPRPVLGPQLQPVTVVEGSLFPSGRIEEYDRLVRAFYGGQFPVWSVP